MRVLHLLDPDTCGDEGVLACAAAQSIGNTQHTIWLLGNARAEQLAWSLGIETADRVQPRFSATGRPDPLPGLKRLWQSRRAHSTPDIIQCWSLEALRLARSCFTGPSAPPRVAVIPRPPINFQAIDRPTDRDLATGREVIAAFDLVTRAALAPLIGHPHDADRWLTAVRLLDPPAFPHGGPLPIDRAALRDSLGLDPTDIALAWLADPPCAADAHHIMFAAGVLHAIGHRTVSLIRRGARNQRRGVSYLRTHSRRWGMILTGLSLPHLLAAGDVCVIDATAGHEGSATCGPVAAALALSIAVPIAAAPNTFIAQAPADWPARIALSPAAGRIAVPIAAILEDAALRVNLAAAARFTCGRARARNGFRTTLHEIWAECAPLAAPTTLAQYGLVPA